MMPARTRFHRANRPGRDTASTFTERVTRASRAFVAPTLNNELPTWERFSPLVLLATLSTLPLVAVTSGTGSLFGAWLLVAYLLAGYLWVEQADDRAGTSHQWRAFVLAGTGLGAIALRLPASAGAILAAALGLAAIGAVAAGIRLHAPAQPIPWYLLTAGLALAEVGHAGAVIWTIRSDTAPPATSFISQAGVALLAVSLWLILHRRTRGSSLIVLLDTAIVTAGIAMMGWVYLVAPRITAPAPTTAEQAVLLGWPLAGLAALIVAVRFLLTRWPDDITSRQFAGAGLVLLIAAISAWSAIANGTSEMAGHPATSLLWLLALIGFGAAALHPSMTQLTSPIHEQPAEMNWQRGLQVTLALLMAPAALLAQAARGDDLTIEVIAGGTILLGLLFAARMATIERARTATSAADRLLRLAAADLIVTHGHDAIIETAVDAARAIGGSSVTTSLYLDDGAPGEYICRGGSDTHDGTSRIIRERDLPRAVRRVLAAGTSAWLDPDDVASVRGTLGLADNVSVISIAPLCGEPELRGLLVSAGNGLTNEIAHAQEALASLLALALDRQRLAAELGYEPGRNAFRAQAADGTAFTFVEVATPEVFDSVNDASDTIDRSGQTAPTIAGALRAAIEKDRLIARYQPRLDLVRGRITGVEMTAAWDSPLVGPIPRNALSAIASEHGLSQPLRLALLLRACRQTVDWQTVHSDRLLDIVLPLHLSEIEVPGLAEDVGLALAETDCDASRLVLQFTAATLLESTSVHLAELSDIAAIGVQLTISETGGSWSELERLNAFPFSAIELEASLVNRLDTDERAAAIATHLIGQAHNRGAVAVAHGIDRRESWVQLRKLGCDLGQGTLFSPPVDAEGVSALLDRAQQRAS